MTYAPQVINDEGLIVADVDPENALMLKYALANARLIAAAPELLAALEPFAKPGCTLWFLPDLGYCCSCCISEPQRVRAENYIHYDDCPVLIAQAIVAKANSE
jgi:hypothetical protein